MFEKAKEKLEKELKGKFDKYGEVMKKPMCDALLDFCRQDDEFAQAVVQGGTLAECMDEVKNVIRGQAVSDMEAYGAAVGFYFPGAEIRVKMTIDLCAGVRTLPEREGIVLDLSDFF